MSGTMIPTMSNCGGDPVTQLNLKKRFNINKLMILVDGEGMPRVLFVGKSERM